MAFLRCYRRPLSSQQYSSPAHQTDLAEMTGATRVSINKALGRFRRQGWVKVKGRKFTIVDRDSLENLIELAGG